VDNSHTQNILAKQRGREAVSEKGTPPNNEQVGNIPSFACSRLASANIFFWKILAAYFARILSPVHNGGNSTTN
jgi:hypothetical protein